LIYKKTFASEGNEDITIGLIQDFFGFTPKKLVFKLPYSIDECMKLVEKNEIPVLRQRFKDVRASLFDSDFIGELQLRKLKFFEERFFLYLCDGYRSNYDDAEKMAKIVADAEARGAMPKVNRNSNLKPVYQLIILGENHYVDGHPLRIFEPYDPMLQTRPDKELFRQAYFELGKDRAKLRNDNQRHWRDYFVEGEVDASAPEYIRRAAELLAVSNLSKEEREIMSLIDRAVADYEADLADAESEGHRRGMLEVARNLLAKNSSFEFVQEVTGLDRKTVEDLASQPA
jgi:hypothetical protein